MYPDLIKSFEEGTLALRGFDHKQHVYIAWVYLQDMPFQDALDRYSTKLKALLEKGGYGHKFSPDITRRYFDRIDASMKAGAKTFENLIEGLDKAS